MSSRIEQLKGVGIGTVSVRLSTVAHIALLPRVIETFRRRDPDLLLKVSEAFFDAIARVEAPLRDPASGAFLYDRSAPGSEALWMTPLGALGAPTA